MPIFENKNPIVETTNVITKCEEKKNTDLIDLIIQLKKARSENNNDDYETIKNKILDRIKLHPNEVNCPNVHNKNLTPLILAVDYPLQDPSIVETFIATNLITEVDRKNALELAEDNLPKENDNDLATPQIQEIINMLKSSLEPSQGGSKKKKTKKKKSKRRKTIKKRRL